MILAAGFAVLIAYARQLRSADRLQGKVGSGSAFDEIVKERCYFDGKGEVQQAGQNAVAGWLLRSGQSFVRLHLLPIYNHHLQEA